MSRRRALLAQAIVLAAVAGGIGRLAANGAFSAYVRPGMRVPLLVSALVLLALAVSKAWRVGDPPGQPLADDHDHDGFPRIGAWLVVPIVCVAVIPILPLGSGAVSERRANVVVASPANGTAPAAPAPLADGEITLLDFMTRAVTLPDRPFTESVTVTGFVAERSPERKEFVLGRFVMSCCAADAQPVLVTVRTSSGLPAEDAWVRVTGTQVPAPPGLSDVERADPANIVLEATEVQPVEQPAQPYLSA